LESALSPPSTKSGLGVFVALLRGVNVGGNNMIKMSALKVSFEKIGFTQVSTYINSGNIIFKTTETDARRLERKIEQMLVKEYELGQKVVVRSLAEIEKLVKSLPRTWDGDTTRWRYNVIFLRHTIDSEDVLADLLFKSDIEETVYCPGALFWTSALLTDLNRTYLQKLSSRKFSQDMTVRNLNTTKKLCELMKKAAQSEN
jgi:uncharacterized protein (DUF1697 family)